MFASLVRRFSIPLAARRPRTLRALCGVALALCAAGEFSARRAATMPHPPSLEAARTQLGRLVVPFVENHGETDARVALVARTATGAVYVGRDGELTYALAGAPRAARTTVAAGVDASLTAAAGKPGAGTARWALKERLVGARIGAVRGTEPSATRVARFAAGDLVHSETTNAYARADLGEAWPGVRVAVQASGEHAEKFFYVAPGADAGRIQLDVDGAGGLATDATGELVAPTGIGDVRFSAPVAWQEIDGARRDVPVRYALLGEHRYGFALGAHDAAHEVVIDPVIQSTYIGGASADQIYAMAIHPITGDVYVTGRVQSTTLFPISAGAIDGAHAGLFDAFVARLPADLKSFTEVTLFGGSGNDTGGDIKIHPLNGDVYLAGISFSTTLPGTTGAAQPAGNTNGLPFVARFTPDLQTLVRTTFYGNNGFLVSASSYLVSPGLSLVISPTTGMLFLSCSGHATTLPNATGGAIVTHGEYFGYVTAIAADLASFGQGTYVSGTTADGSATFVSAMAIDPANDDIVVTGVSDSTVLPVTAGAAIATNTIPGNSVARPGFIARFPKELSSVKALTYYYEQSNVLFPSSVMLVGTETVIGGEVNATTSTPLPGMAGGANPTPYSFQSNYGNGFVVRLSNDLKTIIQGTYVRGNAGPANATSVIYDAVSNSYVVAIGGAVAQLPGLDAGTDTAGVNSYVTRFAPDLKSVVHSIALSTGGGAVASARSPLNGDLYIAGFGSLLANAAGGAQPVNNNPSNGYNGFITRMTIDLSATASPGQIAFGDGAYQTSAGTAGSVIVTRSAGSSGQVSVNVTTTDGSATAPADYAAVTTSVTFADGDTTAKAVSIPTTARSSSQGNKTVNVTLSAAAGGATLGGQASTVLTIADAPVVVVPPAPPASTATPEADTGGGAIDGVELLLLLLAMLGLGLTSAAKSQE